MSDWFDDFARLAGTTAVSRRQVLKAAGSGFVASVFLGFPRLRVAGHRLDLLDSAFASTSPTHCNWGDEAFCLTYCTAALAKCVDICAASLGLGCFICVPAVKKCFDGCRSTLQCQCPNGTTVCRYDALGLQGDCCEPPEICTDGFGCQRPCKPCEVRNWAGRCVSNCPNPGFACCPDASGTEHCVDTQNDSNNCGGCGHECSGLTTLCQGGICRCPEGYTSCGSECCDDTAQQCCPGGYCIPLYSIQHGQDMKCCPPNGGCAVDRVCCGDATLVYACCCPDAECLKVDTGSGYVCAGGTGCG
jgi:hypothetical protein